MFIFLLLKIHIFDSILICNDFELSLHFFTDFWLIYFVSFITKKKLFLVSTILYNNYLPFIFYATTYLPTVLIATVIENQKQKYTIHTKKKTSSQKVHNFWHVICQNNIKDKDSGKWQRKNARSHTHTLTILWHHMQPSPPVNRKEIWHIHSSRWLSTAVESKSKSSVAPLSLPAAEYITKS